MATEQFLTFQMNNESYGLSVMEVSEIKQWEELTAVPDVPSYVRGVMNLRGKVIPVVDLKRKFFDQQTEIGRESCIIVVETQDNTIGLLVDSVSDVISLEAEEIEPPPNLASYQSPAIRGCGKKDDRVIILLDSKKLFSEDQIQHYKQNGSKQVA